MRVCGVIAEYNPFHSGHAYQIFAARKMSGCDFCIAVMSGDFVQRGAPALVDKYNRARQALLEGADLVLMLPVYGSTASAEGFASAGVAALVSTGVTDTISFGCENISVCSENYRRLAGELSEESNAFQSALADGLSSGMPYAAARIAAIHSCYGTSFDPALLNQPNNLLAFEYMRALERFHARLQVCPVERQGSYHAASFAHDAQTAVDATSASATGFASTSVPATGFASATACRQALLSDSSQQFQALADARQIPSEVCRLLADYAKDYDYLHENDLSQMLHYALLSQAHIGYGQYLDCSSDLSARITGQLDKFEGFTQFCDVLKNKSVTRARIARTLIHILLQLPSKMPAPLVQENGTLPYLRVLGFRKSAAPLLHEIKKRAFAPLITRAADAADLLSAKQLAYFKQDLFASEIYRSVLLHKCGRCYPDDYRRRIEIL